MHRQITFVMKVLRGGACSIPWLPLFPRGSRFKALSFSFPPLFFLFFLFFSSLLFSFVFGSPFSRGGQFGGKPVASAGSRFVAKSQQAHRAPTSFNDIIPTSPRGARACESAARALRRQIHLGLRRDQSTERARAALRLRQPPHGKEAPRGANESRVLSSALPGRTTSLPAPGSLFCGPVGD
jgi:hypothetical protein